MSDMSNMAFRVLVAKPDETAEAFAARLVCLAYWHNAAVHGAFTPEENVTVVLEAKPGSRREDVLWLLGKTRP